MNETLEKTIGISFKNKLLLQKALTHRSYLNEHPAWPVPHNERLEFLGDAVLELVTTEFLFQKYTESSEGVLTSIRSALVNHRMLVLIAKDIHIESQMFLSRGEAKGTEKARNVILANAVEALIGALYLDQGYDIAKRFIEHFILVYVDKVIKEELYYDPKTLLQEIAQEQSRVTPSYNVLAESGPDHKKDFVVGVFFDEALIAKGQGTSKHEAERNAASAALKSIVKKSELLNE